MPNWKFSEAFIPGRYAMLSGVMVVLVGLSVFPAFSQTHYSTTTFLRCTRDEAILKAFNIMQTGKGEPSLRRIVDKPIRVLFKDMKTIHKSLKNYDALSWISNQGEHVIFVNEKHRGAPPEALAALISHEAMHDDEFNSVHEEIESWRQEALVWMEMKSENPALANMAANSSSLLIRENKIEQEYRKGTLATFVRSSPAYKGLPETSPGFDQVTASTDLKFSEALASP